MALNFLKKIVLALISLVGVFFRKANRVNVRVLEQMDPRSLVETKHGPLVLSSPTALCLWRARTLFTKEPDTIGWIDSLPEGDLFFDVGANIGLYSLYAAKKGLRVFAFEPESQNYAQLNKNIHLNRLDDRCRAFPLALGPSLKADCLYLSSFVAGAALNNFGEAVDFEKNVFKPSFKQGAVSISLDALMETLAFPVPHHLKIDVDGLERSIVNGASKVLRDPRLKSVLIEINEGLSEDREILSVMKNAGLELTNRHRSSEFDNTPYRGVYNHIFRRPGAAR